jgi:undecaprenyl-diphosphatase
MPEIDQTILAFLNQAARRWPVLDAAMVLLVTNDLLKGAVLVTALCWAWWSKDPKDPSGDRRRLLALGGLLGSVVAVFLARLIAVAVPFRTRPVLDPGLGFVPPLGVESVPMEHWSAFPSDHVALYVGLATTLIYISPRLGAAALVYVLVVDGFARIYVGAHHPTDILAGALLGVAAAVLATTLAPRIALLRRVVVWSWSHPQISEPVLFVVFFQFATVFDSARALGRFVLDAALAIVSRVLPRA